MGFLLHGRFWRYPLLSCVLPRYSVRARVCIYKYMLHIAGSYVLFRRLDRI